MSFKYVDIRRLFHITYFSENCYSKDYIPSEIRTLPQIDGDQLICLIVLVSFEEKQIEKGKVIYKKIEKSSYLRHHL